MPIYEYEREDGTVFEVTQSIKEDSLTVCPDTGQKVRRLISQSAFHLKGSGWYKTDYSKGSSSTGSSGSSSTDSAPTKKSDDSGATETKAPATKSDACCGGGCSSSKE